MAWMLTADEIKMAANGSGKYLEMQCYFIDAREFLTIAETLKGNTI
jgi:hypothetical protein